MAAGPGPTLFPAGPPTDQAVDEGNSAILAGWGPPADKYRWSQCPVSRIVFRPGDDFRDASQLTLAITAESLEEQTVVVSLNDTPVGTLNRNDRPWIEVFRTQELTLDSALIRPGEMNTLTFEFPEARMPGLRWLNMRFHLDQRPLALALHKLVLREE